MFARRHRRRIPGPGANRGTSMLEILITIVILTFGMLGLAGLQAKSHTAELESYQRGQALILLQDMVSRMQQTSAAVGAPNPAANYVTATPLGTGATDLADCSTGATQAAIDQCEWSKAIKGSTETKTASGTTTNQGAMINGRGCVHAAGANAYLISVVWQGLNATAVPATACGSGLYDSESTRRAVSAFFQAANLN